MALIHCPDCDSEISDMAPFCKDCGRPIAGHVQPVPSRGHGGSGGLTAGILAAVVMGVILVVVAAAVLFLFVSVERSSSPAVIETLDRPVTIYEDHGHESHTPAEPSSTAPSAESSEPEAVH